MKTQLIYLIAILFIHTIICQQYGADSGVIRLTDSNFQKLVMDSDEIWLVKFSANWCGHCKSLVPEYTKLAKATKGIFKIGYVDVDDAKQLASRYQIQGTPSLKIFGEVKSKPTDYNGGRDAKSMYNLLMKEAESIVNKRFGGGGSQRSSSSKSNNKKKAGEVIQLDDNNFDDLVMNTEDIYFVKFYAPWCGHCKSLAPTWIELAGELANEGIKVAEVDATQAKGLGSRFQIQGYPTIKFFHAYKKGDSSAVSYEGGRDLSSLKEYAIEQRNKYRKAQFKQLINQEIYDKFCTNLQRGACFIAFLPHIYDISAEERNAQLSMIKKIADNKKTSPITFLWAQGGDFFQYEDEFLNLGTGYPTFFGISHSKKVFTNMKSAFTEKNIETFVERFLQGRESMQKLKPVQQKLSTVTKWDGKDKKPQADSYGDEL